VTEGVMQVTVIIIIIIIIMGTAHTIRKELTIKNKRAKAGTRDRDTINNKDRIAATCVFPRDVFCLGDICTNNLHKGGIDDDDDDNDDDNDNNKLRTEVY
jgi:hypothetical protein